MLQLWNAFRPFLGATSAGGSSFAVHHCVITWKRMQLGEARLLSVTCVVVASPLSIGWTGTKNSSTLPRPRCTCVTSVESTSLLQVSLDVCEQACWARSAGNSAIENVCIIIIIIREYAEFQSWCTCVTSVKSISLLQVSVLGDYAEFRLWCTCVTSVESISLLQVSVLRDYAEFQWWCPCVTNVESIPLL